MPLAKAPQGRSSYWEDLGLAMASIPGHRELRQSRILVTGATGMLCSSIVDILLFMNRELGARNTIYVAGRNEQVALERFGSFTEDDGLVFVPYDATSTDRIAFNGTIDFIIHGASNANPDLYMQKPVETMMANLLGLARVFNLAKDTSTQRVVYVSSSEIYGQKADSEPFAEGDYGYLDILNERAGYPSSKRAGESLCVAYGMEHDIDSVIVRPGHIYGPAVRDSDNRASAEFTRTALAGDEVVLRSKGAQLRSYCYALDCASAILTVMLRGDRAHAYNISNPNSICTISEIAEAIAAEAGVGLSYSDDSSITHSLMQNSSLDSTRLESLGWIPAFDLTTGVARMLTTLRETPGLFTL